MYFNTHAIVLGHSAVFHNSKIYNRACFVIQQAFTAINTSWRQGVVV